MEKIQKKNGEKREEILFRPTKSKKAKKVGGSNPSIFSNPRGRLQKRMLGIVGNECQDELQTQS